MGTTEAPRDRVTAYLETRYTHLLRLAYLLTAGDRAASEDVVHDALLKLHRSGVGGVEDLDSYAARCVINQYRTWQRQQSRRRERERAVEPPSFTDLGAVGERLDVLRALAGLRERERAAVVLRYFADVDDEHAARILGCSRNTVRSLIHRALPQLRAALDEGES